MLGLPRPRPAAKQSFPLPARPPYAAGERLCYDPALRLQLLVDSTAACEGDGSGAALMRHFPHPPLQGAA